MVAVDWGLLAAAMAFYRSHGYEEVELPWLEDRDILSITCPDEGRILSVGDAGSLLGSAEQAFLARELRGELERGRYVACTPCFRNEPVVSDTHRVGFMKVELYCNLEHQHLEAGRMLALARRFMEERCGRTVLTEETDDGTDLSLGGVEVGSYGYRRARGVAWAYGTGIAEPRFSVACRLEGRSHA